MKLVLSLFSAVTLASRVTRETTINAALDISIDDPLSGISAILRRRAPSLASKISSHGCHCSMMDSLVTSGGVPIDGMDRICRNWISKRKCILKMGGACQTGAQKYQTSISQDCDSSPSCESLACEIDTSFITKINEYITANANWSNRAAVCTVTNGIENDACCGSSVETLTPYNMNSHVCENGNVNRRQSADDCTNDETWDGHQCITTQCSCPNGVAHSGASCPAMNSQSCQYCNNDYKLNSLNGQCKSCPGIRIYNPRFTERQRPLLVSDAARRPLTAANSTGHLLDGIKGLYDPVAHSYAQDDDLHISIPTTHSVGTQTYSTFISVVELYLPPTNLEWNAGLTVYVVKTSPSYFSVTCQPSSSLTPEFIKSQNYIVRFTCSAAGDKITITNNNWIVLREVVAQNCFW